MSVVILRPLLLRLKDLASRAKRRVLCDARIAGLARFQMQCPI
jgi:hypothetical protein